MTTTRSQDIAADVAALLRARNPVLWIVTREEGRVEGYIMEAAAAAGYVSRCWDCGQGVTDMAGKVQQRIGSPDPGESLAATRLRQAGNAGLAEQVEELADDWYPADSEIRAVMARVEEMMR